MDLEVAVFNLGSEMQNVSLSARPPKCCPPGSFQGHGLPLHHAVLKNNQRLPCCLDRQRAGLLADTQYLEDIGQARSSSLPADSSDLGPLGSQRRPRTDMEPLLSSPGL